MLENNLRIIRHLLDVSTTINTNSGIMVSTSRLLGKHNILHSLGMIFVVYLIFSCWIEVPYVRASFFAAHVPLRNSSVHVATFLHNKINEITETHLCNQGIGGGGSHETLFSSMLSEQLFE